MWVTWRRQLFFAVAPSSIMCARAFSGQCYIRGGWRRDWRADRRRQFGES